MARMISRFSCLGPLRLYRVSLSYFVGWVFRDSSKLHRAKTVPVVVLAYTWMHLREEHAVAVAEKLVTAIHSVTQRREVPRPTCSVTRAISTPHAAICASICSVKCSPAVRAATDPRSRETPSGRGRDRPLTLLIEIGRFCIRSESGTQVIRCNPADESVDGIRPHNMTVEFNPQGGEKWR